MTPRKAAPAATTEAEFLADYDPTRFAPVAVTVDLALLTIRDGRLSILLIERGQHPHKGAWALPGGFVNPDETLDAAARREMSEETGIDVDPAHIEQLRTYGDPGRDPRMRVVSVAYLCFVPVDTAPVAGDDAADTRWWAIDDLLDDDGPDLAFDHATVIADAVERCRSKIEYTTLAAAFLAEPFTMGELRRVYEAVWGGPVGDAANFGRKARSVEGFLIPDGASPAGKGHHMLFRRGDAELVIPPLMRPSLKDPQ